MRKRIRFAKRDKKAVCFQLVIPTVALLLGLALLKSVHIAAPPSRVLSSAPYNVVNGVRADLPLPVWGPDRNSSSGLMSFTSQRFGGVSPSFVPDLPSYMGFNCNTSLPEALDSWQAPYFQSRQGIGMSWYLLDRKAHEATSAYGAVLVNKAQPQPQSHASAAVPQSADVQLWYEVLQNSTAPHATPVFINMVNDAAYKWVSGNASSSITVRSAPFPYTRRQRDNINNGISFTAVLFIIIAFSFIPASFAVFVVKEREVNAKHQQLISGVSIPAYWCSTFCFDALNYLVPCILSIVLVVLFDISQCVCLAVFVCLFVCMFVSSLAGA